GPAVAAAAAAAAQRLKGRGQAQQSCALVRRYGARCGGLLLKAICKGLARGQWARALPRYGARCGGRRRGCCSKGTVRHRPFCTSSELSLSAECLSPAAEAAAAVAVFLTAQQRLLSFAVACMAAHFVTGAMLNSVCSSLLV